MANSIASGRATKTEGGYLFSGSHSIKTPQQQFREKIQEEIDHKMKCGPVVHITEGIGKAEKMSPVELKRIQVITKIKKNPRLKGNDFLRQMLSQKRPLTEAQCDAALKTIGIMNSIIRGQIEKEKENK